MKNRIGRVAWIIVVLVFAAGVAVFANAIHAARSAEPKSFVVTYLVSNNGAPTSIRTEFVKATGEWKSTAYGLGSVGTRTLVGTVAAQYEIGTVSIDFLTSADVEQVRNLEKAFRTIAFHKNHPDFVREEYVAGLKTYVHRGVEPDGSGAWVENFYAPETGLTSLKTVMHHSEDSEFVIQAISVQFREVLDYEVALPNLPVKFDKAEQVVEDSRRANPQVADELTSQIERAKQKHKSQ